MEPIILPAKHKFAGFTGSRNGLTSAQWDKLFTLLTMLEPARITHGDCIGADELLHTIALSQNIRVLIRPPIDDSKRAFCNCRCGPLVQSPLVQVCPTKPYIERNHDIVNFTDYMIACPNTRQPQLRSGTWATVRYASKQDKVVYLVFPDGRLDRQEPKG